MESTDKAVAEATLRESDSIYDRSWLRSYAVLKAYVTRVGDCKVPFNYKDKQLANFVIRQRRRYRAGKLAAERVAMLNLIGFVWEPLLPSSGVPNVEYNLVEGYRAVCGTRNAQISHIFTFTQYGHDGALREAIKARRKMLKANFTKSRNDPSVSTRMLNIRAAKYERGMATLLSGDLNKIIGINPYRNEAYRARIKINGKMFSKWFSINKYGNKKALELAKKYVGSLTKLRKKAKPN